MIPIPALPVRPTGAGFVQTGLLSGQPGILNAPGLNHRLIDDPPGGYRLAPGTTSGRPPSVLVFDGSKPENDGVKNCPDCHIVFQAICHPPSAASTTRLLFARYFRPRPNGSS